MSLFSALSPVIGPAAIGAGYLAGGSLGAGLAAGGLGFMGAQSTNEANKDIAAENNAWSAAQYANRYETTVDSLKNAGLNPMLAYSQGAGSTPTAQAVQFQNPAAAGVGAYQSAASGTQSFASASQAEAATRQADANVDKIKEETQNIPVERDRLKYAIQLLAEQAALTAQKTQSETITQRVMQQTILKLKSETSLLDLDVDAAKLLDNFGREYKQYAPIVDLIKSTISRGR